MLNEIQCYRAVICRKCILSPTRIIPAFDIAATCYTLETLVQIGLVKKILVKMLDIVRPILGQFPLVGRSLTNIWVSF